LISVEYHTDLKEVQSDPGLAAFLGDGGQSAPFDRLAWWQGLTEHCGLAPLLTVARDGGDLAVLPLASAGADLEGLANWYTFRLRPLVSPGADGAALLMALARDLARRAARITLSGIPDEDGSTSLLEAAFRRAGWVVFREACDSNHVLEVQGRIFEAFLAGRPGQLRTTLKRKKHKVGTRILTEFDEAAWADYEAIYAESWKPSEGSPDFLRQFAKAEGVAGRLRLGIATAEGRAIAAQMWTIEGNTAFIHKLAHREEAKPLSPGSVLSAALFEHVIDRDHVAMIDFGTGDDPYKRDWMELVRRRYRLDMYRPGNPRNWPKIARRALTRLAPRGNHG
jgi:CelD/BcsL family acetyltransferase involved in cellulose biosynthesis